MSLHPSLKEGSESKKHKSVLKRLERLLHLIKKDEWKQGDSVFAFPKVKILKFKVKKEKAKEAEGELAAAAPGEVAEGAAPAEGGKKAEAPAGKEAGKEAGKGAGKKEAGKDKK